MVITIKLFGLTRTLAGNQPELAVTVDGEARIKDLVDALGKLHPELGELILKKKVLVSVNQEIAHEETDLDPRDEVALLPPFAGGTDMDDTTMDETMMVRVQRENFSIDAEIDRVRGRSARIGGIAVFLGTARDRSKGRDVSGITFEGMGRSHGSIYVQGSCSGWRIDHCEFDLTAGHALEIRGETYGVIDNCHFGPYTGSILVTGTGMGDASWQSPQSLGTADRESELLDTLVAQAANHGREVLAGQRPAAAIEGDEPGPLGQCGQQQLAFPRLQRLGRQGAAFFHFFQG